MDLSRNAVDLTIIISCWLLMFAAYSGWGILIANISRVYIPASDYLISHIWLGWVFSILFFSFINIFYPLNYFVSITFLGIGLAAFIARRHFIFCCKRIIFFVRKNWISFSAYSVIVFLISSRAMLAPRACDSGLYHFNSVRWLNEYAIIPGLGNLHGRLAFNQNFFTYNASLNLYPYIDIGHNLANGFLVVLLFSVFFFRSITYIRKIKSPLDLSDHEGPLSIFFMFVLIFISLTHLISSPTPDIASLVLQVLIFTYFVRFLYADENINNKLSVAAIVLILSAVAVTFKLSNLFFTGLVSISLFSLLYLDRDRIKVYKESLSILWAFVLSGLILLIWLIRGVIYSGYPFYPSTVGRLSFDWTMPIDMVKAEAQWVYSWARLPGLQPDEVLGNWHWVGPWLHGFINHRLGFLYTGLTIVSIGMIILFVLLWLFNNRSNRYNKSKSFKPVLVMIIILISLIIWFITAPSTRFANALFFLLFGSAYLMVREQLAEYHYRLIWNKRKSIILSFAVLGIIFFGYWLSNVKNSYNLPPVISLHGIEPIPIAKIKQLETDSGLQVWVPDNEIGHLWDSPLPATPFFNPRLGLRGTEVQEGFKIFD